MSNGMPDSEQYTANNRDTDRPKIIRVIGGPAIKHPDNHDFQRVDFTFQGLSELVGLEYADTIVYWPSPTPHRSEIISNKPAGTLSVWGDLFRLILHKSPLMGHRICTVLGSAFAAAYRGAAVAVIVPSSILPRLPVDWWCKLYRFLRAYSWLSPMICIRALDKGDDKTNLANKPTTPGHFANSLEEWRKIDCNPKILFAVKRRQPDGIVTALNKGIFRPNELRSKALKYFPYVRQTQDKNSNASAQIIPRDEDRPAFRIEPAVSTQKGNALSLVFRYGAGGIVLMTEPPRLEALLGIKTEDNLLTWIELTNRRVPINGQQEDGHIVEVTLSSGAKYDVPMTVSTFRRFLAFCVAAKLAATTNKSGTIELTEMEIGGVNLSGVVDAVKSGLDNRPGQLIQEAFERALKSKYSFIQASPERAKDSRRLHPDYWDIVKFDKLMKQVQKPRKSDTENEDALRKIFSVLKSS